MNRGATYNALKIRALRALSDGQWQSPPAWALRAKFWPLRSSYSYLARLWRFGLLDRGNYRGVFYRINEKGQARLRWLETQGRNSP